MNQGATQPNYNIDYGANRNVSYQSKLILGHLEELSHKIGLYVAGLEQQASHGA